MADWYDPDTIEADWRDSGNISDGVMEQLLDMAQQQVLAYDNGHQWRLDPSLSIDANGNPIPYPGSYPDGKVPTPLVGAQRMQARNLWNAGRVDPSGASVGDDTFVIRPYPLDWVIKQAIRPARAVGSLG